LELLTDVESCSLAGTDPPLVPKQHTAGASLPVSVPGRSSSIPHQQAPEPHMAGEILSPRSSGLSLSYVASIVSNGTIPAVDSDSSTARKRFRIHEMLWSNLNVAKIVTWEIFPWPTLKTASMEDEITAHDIEAYLDTLYKVPENKNNFGTMREYITHNICRWDCNRMEAKVFNRVAMTHQEKVRGDTVRVGGILRAILSRLQE
jgi:hypothetical protein